MNGVGFRYDSPPQMPRNKTEAYKFLQKNNASIQKHQTSISPEDAEKLALDVLTVRRRCRSKNPRLYAIQAKFNPFSKAFKIERLSKKILNTDR